MVKTWQNVEKFKGVNTFARHCITLKESKITKKDNMSPLKGSCLPKLLQSFNSFSTFIQINLLHRQNICCMFNLTTVFVNALYWWMHHTKQEEPQHPNFFGIGVVQLSLRTMTLNTEWLITKNPTVCLEFQIKEVYCNFSSLPLMQGWTFADTDQSWPNHSGFSCVWRCQL